MCAPRCRFCKSELSITFADLGMSPLSNSYVSPERASAAPSGPAADIWAFGVVAYESYAGCRPFEGDSPIAVVHAVMAADHQPLNTVRPDLPTEVCALIERCLSVDPEQRPDSEQLALAFGLVGAP